MSGDSRTFNQGGPVSPGRPIRFERDEKEAFVPAGRDPHARVTKAGRWIYHIVVIDGYMQYGPGGGPWLAWGRAHAMRKAERKLLAHLRDKDRTDHPIIVRPETAEELKRRFLEAQAKPEPWGLVSEPTDTADSAGVWPLVALMAVCTTFGFVIGRFAS